MKQAQATATSSASNEEMKELVKAAVQVATRTSAAVHSTADSVSGLCQSHQEAQQTFKESHLRAEQTAAEALKQREREHGEVERLKMIKTPEVFGPSNYKEEHEGWSEFKHNMKSAELAPRLKSAARSLPSAELVLVVAGPLLLLLGCSCAARPQRTTSSSEHCNDALCQHNFFLIHATSLCFFLL